MNLMRVTIQYERMVIDTIQPDTLYQKGDIVQLHLIHCVNTNFELKKKKSG